VKGIVVADSGPIFSLVVIDKLDVLSSIFQNVKISRAVWNEISSHIDKPFHLKLVSFFEDKVVDIKGFNDLTFIMDYGESESVILYKELKADFLLLDDKKARQIAENFGIKCVGTLGILAVAMERGFITSLKPYFEKLLEHNRYFSLNLLNRVLSKYNEEVIIK
jgi:uncharacterized protein